MSEMTYKTQESAIRSAFLACNLLPDLHPKLFGMITDNLAKVQPAATGATALTWSPVTVAAILAEIGNLLDHAEMATPDMAEAHPGLHASLTRIMYAVDSDEPVHAARPAAEREGKAMAVKGTGIVHELKVWREYFAALMDGRKTFEWRKEDRGFAVGDVLRLREFIPDKDCGVYTGREVLRTVTYWTTGPACGIPEGYCILALAPAPQPAVPVEVSEEMMTAAAQAFNVMSKDLGDYLRLKTQIDLCCLRAALTAALECQRGGA